MRGIVIGAAVAALLALGCADAAMPPNDDEKKEKAPDEHPPEAHEVPSTSQDVARQEGAAGEHSTACQLLARLGEGNPESGRQAVNSLLMSLWRGLQADLLLLGDTILTPLRLLHWSIHALSDLPQEIMLRHRARRNPPRVKPRRRRALRNRPKVERPTSPAPGPSSAPPDVTPPPVAPPVQNPATSSPPILGPEEERKQYIELKRIEGAVAMDWWVALSEERAFYKLTERGRIPDEMTIKYVKYPALLAIFEKYTSMIMEPEEFTPEFYERHPRTPGFSPLNPHPTPSVPLDLKPMIKKVEDSVRNFYEASDAGDAVSADDLYDFEHEKEYWIRELDDQAEVNWSVAVGCLNVIDQIRKELEETPQMKEDNDALTRKWLEIGHEAKYALSNEWDPRALQKVTPPDDSAATSLQPQVDISPSTSGASRTQQSPPEPTPGGSRDMDPTTAMLSEPQPKPPVQGPSGTVSRSPGSASSVVGKVLKSQWLSPPPNLKNAGEQGGAKGSDSAAATTPSLPSGSPSNIPQPPQPAVHESPTSAHLPPLTPRPIDLGDTRRNPSDSAQ
ncbi:hypothetical protein cyc_04766 [Cyclospora cayetanensis]|uniref:Uncharacterized protein n=1 Tax=Cyclospora cayetanensis TaxID=88456 RepID=A0A1D3CY07_9EIME|nr:hypothetical protein cyc_04766 [Cyclospora cayetanensis]